MKKFLHKIGFHFWKFHHGTGINSYSICEICKKRTVDFFDRGLYQPIDYNWLANKHNLINND